jgi:uncharacterized membrane protein
MIRKSRLQFVAALLISSLVSEALFAYSALTKHSLEFDYLSWNLVLAWLPLIFAVRLADVIKVKPWSSWEGMGLSLLWLIFLPNSFYMISDFIHLQDVTQNDVVFYAIMLTSFIYTGVTLGFSSLYLIHVELKSRFSYLYAAFWIAATMFICSVAIYFGRDLRWNSWDVFLNPGGLLVDVSTRLEHLTSYGQMIVEILAFFVLLLAMYNLLWRSMHFFRNKDNL